LPVVILRKKKDAITTVIAWEHFNFMVRTGGLFSLFGGFATLGVGFFLAI
jgi:hypothetical protein